jgi:hypothetical protein
LLDISFYFCLIEPESEDCNPQPDRVGNDHDEDDEVTRDGPDDEGEENCWGKVTSDFASEEGEPGDVGEHSSNPTGDEDNDTPREGVVIRMKTIHQTMLTP